MKKLLLLLSIVAMRQIHGQTFVTIPDANFVTYLQATIPSAMSGNLLNTSSPLVTTTTHSINVNGNSILNLSGIQYFSSLTYLDCGQNYSLSNLPTLPNSLKKLLCYSCNLNSLPTLPNSLVFFSCGFNKLTSLPALPNSLDTLICCVNPLPNLPLLNSLVYLNCSSDSLTTLPALPNSLTYLDCGGNVLNNVPTLPNSLTYLDCSHQFNNASHILTLGFIPSLPNSLKYLDCNFNNIKCFPNFPNSLTYLNLNTNPFNCLPNYVLPTMNSCTTTPLCAAGNSNGCPVANSIEQFQSNIQVTIFPNPTSDQFYIETNATDKLNVDLYDVNGRHVFSASLMDKSNINITTLDNGIYTMTIKSVDGVTNKKLVIAR
ncbi:MAG TPA: T9SS type A sorting domain-containing protein [Bacteroidia bacterium]|jgi:hypothetical protein|nr:T9SS type A sorting domain-containing protein [Bacteroidia bacterium]